MQLGLFGGTFDPIHNAHLSLAHLALGSCRLDKVLFIPSANPPHRTAGPFAAFADRLHMVELACAVEPRFEASRIEEDTVVSYSILTIKKLRSLHPDAGLFFLIGADAFAEIRTWRRWTEVISEVDFIVAGRPGAGYSIPEGARVHTIDMEVPISSSLIRSQLAAGVSDLPLPPAVSGYIAAHHLYSSHNQSKKSVSTLQQGS